MAKFKTAQELHRAYSEGFKGWVPNPAHRDSFNGTLRYHSFYSAAPYSIGAGEGKLSLPFKVQLMYDKEAWGEKQSTGDCISHGCRNACDVTRAVSIFNGEPFGWWFRCCTENIYGSRGYGGEGMDASVAAAWVSKNGGLLLRKKYDFADLSVYDGDVGTKWGTLGGCPKDVTEESKKHQVKTVTQIKSVQEARDALANGYGVSIASNFGYSSTRDKDGISRREGSWPHQMSYLAADDTGKRQKGILLLQFNSWGYSWNNGPKFEQPDGTFWITEEDGAAQIESGDAYAYSFVNGFPPQRLPDFGGHSYL